MNHVEALLSHAPLRFRLLSVVTRWSWPRGMFLRLLNAAVPGLCTHFVARKMEIEEWVRAWLGALSREPELATPGRSACGRLVIVASGLDTLGFRLSLEPQAPLVVEIDHPATQVVKQLWRRVMPASGSGRWELLPCDLASGLINQLPPTTIRESSTVRSLFVLEGLLMYLDETAVRTLLRELTQVARVGDAAIVTFMSKTSAGFVGFEGSKSEAVSRWLSRQSEPFLWGLSPAQAGDFFRSCGWELRQLSDPGSREKRMEPRSRGVAAAARGEHIALLILSSP